MTNVDLNEEVNIKITADGVQAITRGAVLCQGTTTILRQMLKDTAPESYALYRSTKYPAGEGSDTTESRLAATRLLFDLVRDLLTAHYVPSKG